VLALLLAAPPPSPTPTSPRPSPISTAVPDPPSWADQLEAWATLGGAIVALAAAIATIWLLFHQIGETNRARKQAKEERATAAEDRELARRERRDQAATQARTVVIDEFDVGTRTDDGKAWPLIRLTIWNYSSEPVLNLTVILGNEHGERRRLWHASLLKPGGVAKPDVISNTDDDVEYFKSMFPEIYFTDSSGRRWSRRVGGTPSRDVNTTPTWTFPPVREHEDE
jgi:hypothetical protein